MKIQDIIFIFLTLVAIWRGQPKLPVVLGIACLILAIPLFSFWIFFTAERLTWYAAAFFAYSIVLFRSCENLALPWARMKQVRKKPNRPEKLHRFD